MSADVSGLGLDHAGQFLEVSLYAPEATTGKDGAGRPFKLGSFWLDCVGGVRVGREGYGAECGDCEG